VKGKIINDLKAIPFLLPFFLVYVVFTVFPILKGLEMSFYDWTIIRKMDFIALDHYKELIADKNFWKSLWNTTLFVILSTPSMVILALILALMANRNSKFKTFYRSTFFLPSILSVSVISYIAIFMLQPYQGFINTTLHLIGIESEPFWLRDSNLAWLSIVVVTLWWTVGFNMVLFLAALQDIPEELYEAARIDGGKSTQLLRHITLPLLIPIGRVVLLLQILASYKVFAQILLITSGGPGTATRPLIQYIYEVGFRQNNLGYAAALSYALFVILLILSLIQLKGNMIQGGASR